jgi:exopolyphosphatase/guanosine-5'-triphosphate,3'-diphosphate pyrophosphatase
VIRAAAIDIGTNSTRLLVADVEGERLQDVVRRTYAGELEELGATRAMVVATSAVRDAADGRAFLDVIERRFGFPPCSPRATTRPS